MKQKLTIILLCLFFTPVLYAIDDDMSYQWHSVTHNKHEFSVHFGAGLSTLLYDLGTGDRKPGFGMNVGVGYSYTFFRNFSILFGAEIQWFDASVVISDVETRCDAVDFEDSPFNFRSILENYQERQQVTIFQVPVILHYTTQTVPAFYFGAGVKFALPLTGKYSNSVVRIRNSGYYSDEEPIYTSPNNVGFGDFYNQKSNGILNFNTAILATATIGLKFGLGEEGTTSLHVGLYVDYDLRSTGISREEKGHFVSYDAYNSEIFRINSILSSTYTTRENITRPFTDVIRPMNIGIRLRLAFGR
jgi:hypothetical protein